MDCPAKRYKVIFSLRLFTSFFVLFTVTALALKGIERASAFLLEYPPPFCKSTGNISIMIIYVKFYLYRTITYSINSDSIRRII